MMSNNAQYRLLKKCLPALFGASAKAHPFALSEQPLDRPLLKVSALFRKSRERFLAEGGVFHASLLSSPRSLGSSELLANRIEYSPIESELAWSLMNEREQFFLLRNFTTSTFHEQNHRILWKALPPAPGNMDALRRYLNFSESLIIVTDMALGDEFGPKLAAPFYYTGAIYDPGTMVRSELKSKRDYRNYLQTALFATYVFLETQDKEELANVQKAAQILFPSVSPGMVKRACRRSFNLDLQFVNVTNPSWQERNLSTVRKALTTKGKVPALELPKDLMQNHQQYLFAETWFASFGL